MFPHSWRATSPALGSPRLFRRLVERQRKHRRHISISSSSSSLAHCSHVPREYAASGLARLPAPRRRSRTSTAPAAYPRACSRSGSSQSPGSAPRHAGAPAGTRRRSARDSPPSGARAAAGTDGMYSRRLIVDQPQDKRDGRPPPPTGVSTTIAGIGNGWGRPLISSKHRHNPPASARLAVLRAVPAPPPPAPSAAPR